MWKRLLILFALIVSINPLTVKADDVMIHKCKATAYCPTGRLTATGTVPKEGRTIAGKREWFGKTLIVYEDKGNGIEPENYIGTFICEDIGGETIKKGIVVDVLIDDYSRARQFGSKNVIIQIIESEG